jgi:Zn-dependent protease
MLFTINEIFNLIIMVLAIGYIFSGYIKREPIEGYDPINYYKRNSIIEDIKYGAMIAAPAVVLHELAHKFVAMAFGAQAILQAPIDWYVLVIILKLLNFPLLFFVGGYVVHTPLPPLQSALVSVAGPLTNLVLYLTCMGLVRFKLVNKKYYRIISISAQLNLFLAIFNMIPIPGFDGYEFFRNMLSLLF